ncbi:hypothetical protein SISNIDRAFT_444293 [Sistotremastrum niveocremeum HHB9708]|uniref:Disintegrin and metalloproteinase domain-containing protein B n=1 Tax=Sistotremastrum niveocremeum HHB9708 TaxID=1314777 RepID=A0A164R8Y0_9AGAM|nr:hypothetical protein SISNIDRAFT_444293 [Sistotremastrum niveocremeum HHB9708]
MKLFIFYNWPFLAGWLLICILPCVQASSRRPEPLTRIESLTTLSLEVVPRQPNARGTFDSRSLPLDSPSLRHTDAFRLRLSAFSQTFTIHLRPNNHLIHPAARITYHTTSDDGKTVQSQVEPLLRDSVLAFWGEVVHESYSSSWLREDAARLSRPQGTPGDRGWARILVHNQGNALQDLPPIYEGAFSADGETYHILTIDKYLRLKHPLDPLPEHFIDPSSQLVIFRDSDRITVNEPSSVKLQAETGAEMCGHDRLSHNKDTSFQLGNSNLTEPATWYDPWNLFQDSGIVDGPVNMSHKRDDVAGGSSSSNFVGSIGSTAGCPSSEKIVYMGVAADCKYTAQYGSVENATKAILLNWNTASSLYKSTFNISLGIIHLEIHNSSCPSTPDPIRPWNTDCSSVTLDQRLSQFSAYRGTLGDDGAGLWHLMSGCPTGTEVGIAWLGTLCNQAASGEPPSVVSGAAVSTFGVTEWQVISHEIGHNFGAIHDCTSGCNSTAGCCPSSATTCAAENQFLMNPISNAGEMKFSPCSIGNICSLIPQGNPNAINSSCIQDASASEKTITVQMCGNGIVEDGEECDPGVGNNSTCCNSATCTFTAGSVCDPTSDACCTSTCQFSPATQVCRPAVNSQCDIAETCTGNSSACPPDTFHANGLQCGTDGETCANGLCTSQSLQCQTVGSSLGLKAACPNRNPSCSISCQDPDDSSSCMVLQSNFVDGTPCGYGGFCEKGNCQLGSLLDTAVSWYKQNLQIAIPISVAAGLVALVAICWLFSALGRCMRGSSRQGPPVYGAAGPPQPITGYAPGYTSVQPAPFYPQFKDENTSFSSPPQPTGDAAWIPPALRPGPNALRPYAPSEVR